MKFKELYKKLKKENPQINEEQLLSTCRHIQAILSEWKLSVQSDILQYLAENFDCESIADVEEQIELKKFKKYHRKKRKSR